MNKVITVLNNIVFTRELIMKLQSCKSDLG